MLKNIIIIISLTLLLNADYYKRPSTRSIDSDSFEKSQSAIFTIYYPKNTPSNSYWTNFYETDKGLPDFVDYVIEAAKESYETALEFGFVKTGDIKLYIEDMNTQEHGYSDENTIHINSLINERGTKKKLKLIISHELIHIYQLRAGMDSKEENMWFIEGSAQFYSKQFFGEYFRMYYDNYDKKHLAENLNIGFLQKDRQLIYTSYLFLEYLKERYEVDTMEVFTKKPDDYMRYFLDETNSSFDELVSSFYATLCQEVECETGSKESLYYGGALKQSDETKLLTKEFKELRLNDKNSIYHTLKAGQLYVSSSKEMVEYYNEKDIKEIWLELEEGKWQLKGVGYKGVILDEDKKGLKIYSYIDGKWIQGEMREYYGFWIKSNESLDILLAKDEGGSSEKSYALTGNWSLYSNPLSVAIDKIPKDVTIFVYRDGGWIKNPTLIMPNEGFWIKKLPIKDKS